MTCVFCFNTCKTNLVRENEIATKPMCTARSTITFALFIILSSTGHAFNVKSPCCVSLLQQNRIFANRGSSSILRLSDDTTSSPRAETVKNTSSDITSATTTAVEDPMSIAMSEQEEKIRRAEELRAQEVFIKKSIGKHECRNCGWIYDESKGEQGVIGGTIKPGTTFAELPSNWRCPTCRASKDSFKELSEVIPGFAVNQGYGFGGNSLTSGQKSNLIFGGLFLFFLLFIAGYGLS
jgi:rubredoxin